MKIRPFMLSLYIVFCFLSCEIPNEYEFLMVDYEDQLAHEFEDARDELFKQVTSLTTKLNLLWEIVRSMIVFFIPVLSGIGLSFLSNSYLPSSLAAFASTIFNGITIGLVFLNIVPLNEAVTNYLECRVYTPSFVNCTCKKCHDRNNCNKEGGCIEQSKQTCGASDQQEPSDDSGLKPAAENDELSKSTEVTDESMSDLNES